MTIEKVIEGTSYNFKIIGRLDTTTAPMLMETFDKDLKEAKAVVLDFAKLEYISSAGLRVLLSAQKIMNSKGSMVIRNVNENVMEVFEITGFSDILTIE